jgi:glycosyltransferase involved in cell wall biosynthesis
MKAAFNARLLAAPTLRGWNRYTVNLLAELPALGVELFLYGDQPLHESHLSRLPPGSYQVRVAPMRYPLWEQYWLPRQCERDRVDLLHCPLNFGLPWSSPCPRVLTLHDAIDQVYYAPRSTWREALCPTTLRTRAYNWVARRSADHVITVSEHARDDLVRHLGLPRRRVSVTYEAADPHFHAPVGEGARRRVRQVHQLDRPYFFYVGGWERRKNVPFLVRAFAATNLPQVELVLAGGRDGERDALLRLARELGVTDRFRLLGWVAETDLPGLYAEALAFVYPSEYEGFGLQVCEAMAAGCPVAASRRTSLPEIVGDGGVTFRLDDPAALAGLLRQLADDSGLRDALSARGRERAKQFSWTTTARQTAAVYEKLLLGRNPGKRGRVSAPRFGDLATRGANAAPLAKSSGRIGESDVPV